MVPAELAGLPLYAPLASCLARFGGDRLPSADGLDTALAQCRERPVTRSGRPVRFVDPPHDALAYEQRIAATGAVATRAGNWHDFFNALVWMVFPQTKSALNARHCAALPVGRGGMRGPVRDAATQFDESGMIIASADSSLVALLAAHRWRELFWERRAALLESMRFFVFGHGLYDSLRAPFFGLCGRCVVIDVAQAALAEGAGELLATVDALCAEHIGDPRRLTSARELLPLPVLGIPGVTPDNGCAAYYDDTRQFRPPRHAH